MSTRSRHRVLLVREWDQQTTGASCCGRLDGGGELGGAADFAPARADMEAMGAVYRRLTEALPSAVDVQIVDPRNITWLVPALARDAWRAHRRVAGVMRTLHRGTGRGAIVVDGRVVSSGPVPDATTALGLVRAAMTAA
ncbi:hypothetical protein [Egicoccus sp. AB-alg2]|uniref:hypothetical protein n=1 Tax=Egicoccus sp. AB-alg2 TaxID=3242693 RepID=UPI00359D3758